MLAQAAAAIAHRNDLFRFYQQNKSSESKVTFRKASNHGKRILEAAKRKSYGISGQIFYLIFSVIDAFKWFFSRISSQCWSSSRLHSWYYTFPATHINVLPVDVICNIVIYADDTTLYSECDHVSDLWLQRELAGELEPDLQDTVWTWAGSGLLISMLEKFSLFPMTDLIALWRY